METPDFPALARPCRILRAFGDRLNVAMLLANAVGIGVFLWAASHAWANVLGRAPDVPPEPGDAFLWIIYIAPVLLAFALVNLAWVVITCVRRQWRNAAPFVVVVGFWFAALIVDGMQH